MLVVHVAGSHIDAVYIYIYICVSTYMSVSRCPVVLLNYNNNNKKRYSADVKTTDWKEREREKGSTIDFHSAF